MDVVQEEESEYAKVNADSKSPMSYNEQQNNLTRSTTANTRSSIVLLDNNKDTIHNNLQVSHKWKYAFLGGTWRLHFQFPGI